MRGLLVFLFGAQIVLSSCGFGAGGSSATEIQEPTPVPDWKVNIDSVQSAYWYPSLTDAPKIEWQIQDLESSMTVELALGSQPLTDDLLSWQEVTGANWQGAGLNLTEGVRVYPSLRVRSSAGDVIQHNVGEGWIPTLNRSAYQDFQTLNLTGAVRDVVSKDLNGDEYPDLVSADGPLAATVSVFLSNNSGSFLAPVTYAVSNNPQVLYLHDVTGDDVLDLIVGTYAGTVHILKGSSLGVFTGHDTIVFATSLTALDIVDLNSDGKLDIVVARDVGSNTIQTFLNNGSGEFPDAASPNFSYSVAPKRPKCVLARDFNQDGHVDFAVTFYNSTSFLVLWGGAMGETPEVFSAGNESMGLATQDVNGDGFLDIVTAETSLDKLYVYLGSAEGFTLPPNQIDSKGRPHGLMISDMNGDGKLDVLVASNTSTSTAEGYQTLGIHLGDGAGQFQAKIEIPVAAQPYRPYLTDLNQDGKLDLVVGTGSTLSYVMAK